MKTISYPNLKTVSSATVKFILASVGDSRGEVLPYPRTTLESLQAMSKANVILNAIVRNGKFISFNKKEMISFLHDVVSQDWLDAVSKSFSNKTLVDADVVSANIFKTIIDIKRNVEKGEDFKVNGAFEIMVAKEALEFFKNSKVLRETSNDDVEGVEEYMVEFNKVSSI